MDELTTLREQMASMKQSLDRNNIINKKLMNNVMRQRSSWLGNTAWLGVVATPILAIIIYLISVPVGISGWYAVAFFVLSSIDTAFDFKTLRIPKDWFSEMDVITLRRNLIKQKLQRKRQFTVSVTLAAIWGLCWGVQYISKVLGKYIPIDALVTTIVFCVVGVIVIVGILVTLVIFRKAQRTNDDILKELNEYEQS